VTSLPCLVRPSSLRYIYLRLSTSLSRQKISNTYAFAIHHGLVIGALATCIDACGARSATVALDAAQVALSAARQGKRLLLQRDQQSAFTPGNHHRSLFDILTGC
jgi:hypothetical protein